MTHYTLNHLPAASDFALPVYEVIEIEVITIDLE